MATAPDSLVGRSLEWTGVHHSADGDFADLSTHVVNYESPNQCFVTASGQVVGEASYTYRKLDDRVGIVIYRPVTYQGRSDVVLYASLDFDAGTDRAVIVCAGEPFAVANGEMREVAPQRRP